MPIGVTGQLFGLPVTTLNALLTTYTTLLTSIATAGQSYSLGGRTFTRANIAEVMNTIQEIQRALDRANGVSNSFTFLNMNTGGSSSSVSGFGPPTG